MQFDSLKRLVMTIAGTVIILIGNKLGLSQGQEEMITGLLGVFLAQSGVKAAMTTFAASKGGGLLEKALADLAALKAAFDQAQAQNALAAGTAAALKPSDAANG